VDDEDSRVPFRFMGNLEKLTLAVKLPQLTRGDERLLIEEGRQDKKASE
jgi:hypothetical protein